MRKNKGNIRRNARILKNIYFVLRAGTQCLPATEGLRSEVRMCYSIESVMLFFRGISSAVGLSGLEPPTSRLSGVRSNRLSYKPE